MFIVYWNISQYRIVQGADVVVIVW